MKSTIGYKATRRKEPCRDCKEPTELRYYGTPLSQKCFNRMVAGGS